MAALLADLRALGVEVGAEDGRPRVEGPDDVLRENLLAQVRARKAEILRHLQTPSTVRLVVVRHEHRCPCGRKFKCTEPPCAGKNGGGHGEDHLLSLDEAAQRLGTTKDWLRRRKAVPFRVEVSPGQVRYSARGIERFIARAMK